MAKPPPDLAAAYDAHASALYAFLLNVTRSEADAHDLLQEVFIKLARNPGLLSAARDPRAFLIHLSHNLMIDLRRRQAGRERRDEAATLDSFVLFEQGPHPDEAAFREALAAALAGLPPEHSARWST
jgi:RNA polymerase sigma-70 factor (ECF subfamily)